MNVKQGDLAIVIKSTSGNNLGKIVTVEKRIPGRRVVEIDGYLFNIMDCDSVWIVSSAAKSIWTRAGYLFRAPFTDSALRPISGLPDTESKGEQLIKPVEREIA